jgi:hypothetical protein
MAEKNFNNVRIVNKHDTEENWLKATGFTPKQGELIVYDIDSTHSYERIKIGDGSKNVNALPFVDDDLKTELLTQINDVDDKVDAVSVLVGDKKVSEQINTAIANKADAPKLTNVSMLASSWIGESNPWSQVVTINGVTDNSKIDLQPTALQIVELQDNDIALIAENTNGIVTIYALGSKPTKDYTMQALITEVVVV